MGFSILYKKFVIIIIIIIVLDQDFMTLQRFYREKRIYLTQNLNQICFKRLLIGKYVVHVVIVKCILWSQGPLIHEENTIIS